MASALPTTTDCCNSCECDAAVNIPGPSGGDGAAGAAGADGVSAYSELTEPFTLPAEGATDDAEVDTNAWIALGAVVGIESGGAGDFVTFMEVTAKPDATHVTLKNLKNTVTGDYASNPAPGTVFPVGYLIVPSGPQGPAGAAATGYAPDTVDYLTVTGDPSLPSAVVLHGMGTGALSFNDVTNALSVGDLAVTDGGTGASAAAGARTNLSAAKSGANSDITSITGLLTPLTVAQGGTEASTAAGARTKLSAAQSGINNDISELTLMTTPLSVSRGGTAGATAAAARANLGITAAARYVSGTNAFPAAGAHAHHAHGLLGVPTRIDVRCVCTAPDAATGFTTNDVVPMPYVWDSNASVEKPCLQAHADATNVTITRSASAGNLYFLRLADGVFTSTASTNFNYVIIAWYDT